MSFGNTAKDGSGTAYWLLLNTLGQLIVDAGWSPELKVDESLNDSDKTFTVTASEEWEIQSIWVELTTTATAGNRQIVIEIQDSSSDVIGQYRAGIAQAASLTRYYMFSPHAEGLTAFRDTDYLSNPIAPLCLPASYVIRVYDVAAVDAAADDMNVQMMIKKRSV